LIAQVAVDYINRFPIMGDVKLAHKVLLITALCYNNEADMQKALQQMTLHYGPVKSASSPFPFHHTHYYQDEMGDHLFKYYCSFENLIDPMNIVDIKLTSNEIEKMLSNGDKRNVNLDPGYIEVPKLVLATTKNYGHRIYLGKGIYGDVQLVWRQGSFQANPWTYPDYLEPENLRFFINERNNYFQQLQKGVH